MVCTNAAAATAGIELRADNTAYFTKDSDTPVLINRITNDGDLVQFRKDNTIVGSIGTGNTRLYAGSYDTGISFAYDVDTIRPYNTSTGADRDNAINLGSSAARFKDLYLSGGLRGDTTFKRELGLPL